MFKFNAEIRERHAKIKRQVRLGLIGDQTGCRNTIYILVSCPICPNEQQAMNRAFNIYSSLAKMAGY